MKIFEDSAIVGASLPKFFRLRMPVSASLMVAAIAEQSIQTFIRRPRKRVISLRGSMSRICVLVDLDSFRQRSDTKNEGYVVNSRAQFWTFSPLVEGVFLDVSDQILSTIAQRMLQFHELGWLFALRDIGLTLLNH